MFKAEPRLFGTPCWELEVSTPHQGCVCPCSLFAPSPIVSANPAEHFGMGPGAYFHGMVAKAKAGDLHLNRAVWGLRSGQRERAPLGSAAESRGQLAQNRLRGAAGMIAQPALIGTHAWRWHLTRPEQCRGSSPAWRMLEAPTDATLRPAGQHPAG